MFCFLYRPSCLHDSATLSSRSDCVEIYAAPFVIDCDRDSVSPRLPWTDLQTPQRHILSFFITHTFITLHDITLRYPTFWRSGAGHNILCKIRIFSYANENNTGPGKTRQAFGRHGERSSSLAGLFLTYILPPFFSPPSRYLAGGIH